MYASSENFFDDREFRGDGVSFEPSAANDRGPATLIRTMSGAHAFGHAFGIVRDVLGVLISVVLTFLGLLAITFFIGRVIPIDPVLAVVGDRAPKAVYDAARLQLGLDKPLIVQFSIMSSTVAHGDLGMSVSTGRPVLADLARVFPATLEMATIGIIIGVVLGVPMGVYRREPAGHGFDQIIRVVGLLGYSMPGLLAGAGRACACFMRGSDGSAGRAGSIFSMTGLVPE